MMLSALHRSSAQIVGQNTLSLVATATWGYHTTDAEQITRPGLRGP